MRDPSLPDECSTYTESHGFECVPYDLCDEDGTILTDGAGVIDIRWISRTVDIYSTSILFKCLYNHLTRNCFVLRRFGSLFEDNVTSSGPPSVAMLDATDKKCPGSLDVCCRTPDWDYEYEYGTGCVCNRKKQNCDIFTQISQVGLRGVFAI